MGKTEKQSPEIWVDQYGDYLYRYAMSRLNDPEICQDLVQETFFSALKAYKNFQSNSTIKTWLIGILKNKIVDHFRRSGRSSIVNHNWDEHDPDFLDRGAFAGGWKPESAPKEWMQTPIGDLEDKELKTILMLCISLLNEPMQSAIKLKSLEEVSTAEICDDLGITDQHLWVLLHRARKALRSCMEKRYVAA